MLCNYKGKDSHWYCKLPFDTNLLQSLSPKVKGHILNVRQEIFEMEMPIEKAEQIEELQDGGEGREFWEKEGGENPVGIQLPNSHPWARPRLGRKDLRVEGSVPCPS